MQLLKTCQVFNKGFYILIAGVFATSLSALADSGATKAVANEPTKNHIIFGGAFEVDVPRCWRIFDEGVGILVGQDSRICEAPSGAKLEITEGKLANGVPLTSLVGNSISAADSAVDGSGCMKSSTEFSKAFKGMTKSCRNRPMATTFSAYLECGKRYFKIEILDEKKAFDGRSQLSLDELPNTPYRSMLKSLRCKLK